MHIDIKVNYATCINTGCGHSYRSGVGWWMRCPKCHPDQAKPFELRRKDHTEFLGSEWFWTPHRLQGQWERVSDYVFTEHEEWLRFTKAVFNTDAIIERAGGASTLSIVEQELRRLREMAGEPTDYSVTQPVYQGPMRVLTDPPVARLRYDELADKCQVQSEALLRVRADRDELRDKVVELEAKLARIRNR